MHTLNFTFDLHKKTSCAMPNMCPFKAILFRKCGFYGQFYRIDHLKMGGLGYSKQFLGN